MESPFASIHGRSACVPLFSTSRSAKVGLGFYSHLAEASGFYEVPKNMLRVAEGLPFSMTPFLPLVRVHQATGDKIAPNANKVMKDLVGHSAGLGLTALSEVFRDAFDPDVRNGYAHADYVVWNDEIRFPHRNGGHPRAIRFDEFQRLLNRGLSFFHYIFQIMDEHVRSYDLARTIRAQLAQEPPANWTIHHDPLRGTFSISDAPPT